MNTSERVASPSTQPAQFFAVVHHSLPISLELDQRSQPTRSALAGHVIHRVVMLRDVLRQARPLAFLLRIVMLFAMLEEPVLTRVVMTRDLARVMPRTRAVLRVDGLLCRFRFIGCVVQLLVAGVVLIAAVAVADG